MSLRVALAGTGGIAATHAQAIHNYAGAEICAVVTTKADGAAEFRRKFNIPAAYPSLDALLRRERADALIVCTPNALHAPQTIQALHGGLHVLVEKPMATNAQAAAEMQQASEQAGRLLQVGHSWRFDTEVQWLREHIGSLGPVIRTRGYAVHVHWGPEGWFREKSLAGGGALADMGIHAIDTVRYLLGDPQPTSVYARVGTYYIDSDVDDTSVILINWDNGAVSYIESGWYQPHADGPGAATQIYGQHGFGSLFPTLLQLTSPASSETEINDPGFEFPRKEHGPQEIFDRQMAYFFDCIGSGRTPVPGGREGWMNVRICDAAYESSRTGEVAHLRK